MKNTIFLILMCSICWCCTTKKRPAAESYFEAQQLIVEGAALLNSGKEEESLEKFKMALAPGSRVIEDSANAMAYYLRGFCYLHLKD